MSGNPRLVVYGEGDLDTGGESRYLPAPGEALEDAHLGAAHVLVRRCLADAKGVPEPSVRFLSPLRIKGRIHRGGDLLDRMRLRQLLSWPLATLRPDLAVVLVDQDGKPDRRAELERHVEGIPLPRVIGVAVEEFEAWLVADEVAITSATTSTADAVAAPEKLSPRGAKRHLDERMEDARVDRRTARRRIAQACDLAKVRERCPAFDAFAKRLVSTWSSQSAGA